MCTLNLEAFWFYHIAPGVFCRNEAEPLPSPDLYVGSHAFRAVGVGLGLSGVSWVICLSQRTLSSSMLSLSCFLLLLLLLHTFSPLPFTLQPFLQTDEQDEWRRKCDQDFSKMERKHEEGGGGLGPAWDLWLGCISMRNHRLKRLPGFKRADVWLVCCAKQLQTKISWRGFCMRVCVCWLRHSSLTAV